MNPKKNRGNVDNGQVTKQATFHYFSMGFKQLNMPR